MFRPTHLLRTTPYLARWSSTRVSRRKETDFVRRRYKWREALREERLAFLRGEGLGANSETARIEEQLKEERRPKVDPAIVAAREERRKQRQRKHIEMLAEVQERKAVRQAAKAQIWEQRQALNAARAAEELAAVEAASSTWINENTLDEAVERCVDAFFIADDAESHALATSSGKKGAKTRISQ